jgi:hypothetical protein
MLTTVKKELVTIKQRIIANRARLYGKLALAICTFHNEDLSAMTHKRGLVLRLPYSFELPFSGPIAPRIVGRIPGLRFVIRRDSGSSPVYAIANAPTEWANKRSVRNSKKQEIGNA